MDSREVGIGRLGDEKGRVHCVPRNFLENRKKKSGKDRFLLAGREGKPNSAFGPVLLQEG